MVDLGQKKVNFRSPFFMRKLFLRICQHLIYPILTPLYALLDMIHFNDVFRKNLPIGSFF